MDNIQSPSGIQIVEKPNWVSWEDIHDVLWEAHAENRKNGISMRKPSLPGDEIKKEIGSAGKMFVALYNDQVVGSAAIIVKEGANWYNKGKYGYLCFASVLPQYNGCGIYGQLLEKRESFAKESGLAELYFDTHENNVQILQMNEKRGFKRVAVKQCKDHFNIVMVKWLVGCPYSDLYCKWQFVKSWVFDKIRFRIDSKRGLVKRFGI